MGSQTNHVRLFRTALLRLPRPVRTLSPACLPVTDEFLDSRDDAEAVLAGVRCIATGWGQTVFGGSLESDLREVELRVRENSYCERAYSAQYGIDIKEYHLCAGPIDESGDGRGTCVVSLMMSFKSCVSEITVIFLILH